MTIGFCVLAVLALTGCEKRQRKSSGGSLLDGDNPEPTGTVYRFVGVEQSLADARKAVQEERWDQAAAASDALLREQPNNVEAQSINSRARLELANAHTAETAKALSAEAALRQSRAAAKKGKTVAMVGGRGDEKSDEPSSPEPTPAPAATPIPTSAIVSSVTPEPMPVPLPTPREVVPAPAPAPVQQPKLTEVERRALIHDYLEQKVQPHVMRNFSYPKDAERQGAEGTVVVRLTVASSGNLIASKVISCPDPLLCTAALSSANEAAPYSPPPPALGNTVTVDVRFEYHLE